MGGVTFNSVPEKAPEKVWETLVRSQVRFNRVPEKVSEKVLGAKPSQFQQVPEKVAEVQGGHSLHICIISHTSGYYNASRPQT